MDVVAHAWSLRLKSGALSPIPTADRVTRLSRFACLCTGLRPKGDLFEKAPPTRPICCACMLRVNLLSQRQVFYVEVEKTLRQQGILGQEWRARLTRFSSAVTCNVFNLNLHLTKFWLLLLVVNTKRSKARIQQKICKLKAKLIFTFIYSCTRLGL